MPGIRNRLQGFALFTLIETLKACLSNYKKPRGCRVMMMQTFVPKCPTQKIQKFADKTNNILMQGMRLVQLAKME